jgi:hypothetical protein
MSLIGRSAPRLGFHYVNVMQAFGDQARAVFSDTGMLTDDVGYTHGSTQRGFVVYATPTEIRKELTAAGVACVACEPAYGYAR